MENKLIKKIRKHIIHLGLACVLCSAFLGMPVAVNAQDGGPSLPHNFWGYVYIDSITGDPADGVEVTAWIDGEQRGSITTDSSGKYGSNPLTEFPFYLTVTGSNEDIIEFRVDGIVAEEVRWGVLIEEEPFHWEWENVEPSWYAVFDSAEVNGLDLVYTPGPPDDIPPAAITNLAVSSTSSDSATLTWTAPGDDGTTGTASSYDVRYLEGSTAITESNWGSASQASGEPSPQVADSSETFTVTGLNSSTEYYFAIKTADEVPNESGISNSPTGTTEETDDTAPATITDLAVSAVTSISATLTWTAPGDDGTTGTASSYDVRYLQDTAITESNWASASQASGEPSPQVAGSSETFTVTGLNSSTEYYFAIKTADDVPNESDISNSPSGTTEETDGTAPAAIENLAVSGVTTDSATLTWTAPGDDGTTGTASSYDVRYLQDTAITESNWGSASQAFGEPTPQIAGSNETFTVTGLGAETTYYFAIKTADEVPNESGISNSPSETTEETDGTPPAAITDLAVSAVTNNSVTLTWTAPGDDGTTGTASSYDIRYLEGITAEITESNWASATKVSGEPAPQVAGSSETFTVTGLSSSTAHYFAIKSADEIPNLSGISNSPAGTTTSGGGGGGGGGGVAATDNTAPGPITDLAVSGVTSDSATLTWTAPGDDGYTGTASEYDVRYLGGTIITESNWNSANQASGVPVPQAAGSSETFTVTGLDADTNYHFAVKTADEVPIWSGISNSPTGTTSSAGVVTTEEEEEVVTEEEEEVVTEEEEEEVTAEEEEEAVTEEEEEEETIEPTPAAFIITNISISPDTPALDETVTITIDVTNTGETEGTYTVVLRINGEVEATQSITLDGGESGQVVFTTTKDEAGDYTVDINGQSASFTVAQPVQLALILGVIGGVILLGLLIYLGRRMYYARM